MRILLVHNRYQQPGGEDRVVESEEAMLRGRLHQVVLHEVDNDGIEGPINSLKTAVRCLWSIPAQRHFSQLVHDFVPDVVHVHNFFPLLSPAIHHTAHRLGIPVVQTLHNYRLLCPAATMFRDGEICDECTHQWYPVSSIRHACYRKSRAATAAVANMLVLHQALGTWNVQVSHFIALSEFARRKFVDSGIRPERISVKPNFIASDPGFGAGKCESILYVGRLADEKRIACLLEAWKTVRSGFRLVIVGDGPLAPMVREFTMRDRSVQWFGFMNHSEVLELMGSAFALVFPSVWFEGFPLVLAEALAKGLPVIASDLGSMAEIIQHRKIGLLFSPGSPLDLANALRWAFDHPAAFESMRQQARREFESKYTSDTNYTQLMKIYSKAQSNFDAMHLTRVDNQTSRSKEKGDTNPRR